MADKTTTWGKIFFIYILISDCVKTVYELQLLPNNSAVKHFYTNRERFKVLTGYLSLGHRRGGGWTNTFTIPSVNWRPKCPDEVRTSEHPLPIAKGSCLVYVTTTEQLGLALSADYLSLLSHVRTVDTFW